jgi:hypothetical protein
LHFLLTVILQLFQSIRIFLFVGSFAFIFLACPHPLSVRRFSLQDAPFLVDVPVCFFQNSHSSCQLQRHIGKKLCPQTTDQLFEYHISWQFDHGVFFPK